MFPVFTACVSAAPPHTLRTRCRRSVIYGKHLLWHGKRALRQSGFAAAVDGAVQATDGEADADFFARLDGVAAREGFAVGVAGERVAALQDVERA